MSGDRPTGDTPAAEGDAPTDDDEDASAAANDPTDANDDPTDANDDPTDANDVDSTETPTATTRLDDTMPSADRTTETERARAASDERTDTRETADAARTDGGDSDGGDTEDGGGSGSRVRRYVDYAILGGLLLLAFVAVVQFYLAAGSAINTWITREYRSLFRALFNLVVLFVVGGAIVYQLRRMDLGGRRTD